MEIILHFKGGLGNQLIQYAFVKSYFDSEKNELIFDTSHYYFIRKRKFFLNDFPQKKISSFKKINLLLRLYIKIIYSRINQKIHLPFAGRILSDYVDDTSDIENVLKQQKNYLFLNGYFQHVQIFPLNQGNYLIKHLDSLSYLLKGNKTKYLIDNSINPIMLHLRRGDYVTNENVKKQMGSCSIEYFRKGIKYLSENLENFTLFIFSDDIEFAATFFNEFKSAHFIQGDLNDPVIDFLLMRCFKYAVISNSTLSYMSAILSTHEDNHIVIPRPWFNNGNEFLLGIKPNWKHVDKE